MKTDFAKVRELACRAVLLDDLLGQLIEPSGPGIWITIGEKHVKINKLALMHLLQSELSSVDEEFTEMCKEKAGPTPFILGH